MALERLLALGGLVLVAPALAAVAIAIAWEDGRPVLFRQVRVGRNGRPFELVKFRSMRVRQAATIREAAAPAITAAGDARITRVGAVIRRLKLDELPQLWNVVRGEMSFIGPRPEVPRYVDETNPVWRQVLAVRPGITDLATLIYRSEEEVLAAAECPETFYRTVVLPEKLRLNLLYLERRSAWSDLKLLSLTVRYSLFPGGFNADLVRQHLIG